MPRRRPPNVLLGEALRRLREDRGLSQRALADASGVHANTVGLIERGERDPGWNRLVKLADGLGVTMTEIVERYERIKRRA